MTIDKPVHVTFTGVDENTNLDFLSELSATFPIEWGLLVGGRLGGNRYPSEKFRHELARREELSHVKFALHICGSELNRKINAGELPFPIDDFEMFSRVQVNAVQYDERKLSEFSQKIGKPVIMQYRKHDLFPYDEELESLPGVHLLHDPSGGRGKVPDKRPIHSGMRLAGYAGGIGPDNVQEVLSQIDAQNFWIDMESKIRTEDWLDLDKCERVCQLIWR